MIALAARRRDLARLSEVLWSTRSADEYDEVRADRMAGYEWLTAGDVDWRRAIEVQAEFWRLGQARITVWA